MQKSYCYTPGVGIHVGVSVSVRVHIQHVRANVLKSLGISVFLYFLLLLNFAYHTYKAPYNKTLQQACIRWQWHLRFSLLLKLVYTYIVTSISRCCFQLIDWCSSSKCWTWTKHFNAIEYLARSCLLCFSPPFRRRAFFFVDIGR